MHIKNKIEELYVVNPSCVHIALIRVGGAL